MNIPLIITNFNQETYLINLINWWQWYYPQNKVYILDNKSNALTQIAYMKIINLFKLPIEVVNYEENNSVENLKDFLLKVSYEYYVVSDPDIMPLPNTPPNFLEIFKHAIDVDGFHHVGFGLVTHDVPDWFEGRANMLHDELSLLTKPAHIKFEGNVYSGFKAPIDTTFALYKKSNGGWTNPQSSEAWDNSLRLFYAYHLPWYIHPDHLNNEMKMYFATARYREPGVTSTGVNNYRPNKYKNDL